MPDAKPLAATIATFSTDQAPFLNRTCLAKAPPPVILAACVDEVSRLTSLLNLCTHLDVASEADDDGLVWLFTYFRGEFTALGRLLRSFHYEFMQANVESNNERDERARTADNSFREA